MKSKFGGGKGDRQELVGIISGLKGSGGKSVENWLTSSKVLTKVKPPVTFEVVPCTNSDQELEAIQFNKYSLIIFVVDLEKPENNILCNQWYHKIRARMHHDNPCLILANKKDTLPANTSDSDVIDDVKGWLNIQAESSPKATVVIKPISAKRLLENVRFKEGDYNEVFDFIKECLKAHSDVAHSLKSK